MRRSLLTLGLLGCVSLISCGGGGGSSSRGGGGNGGGGNGPSVTLVSPAMVTPATLSSGYTIQIAGENFSNMAVVLLNGSELQTFYESSTLLHAVFPQGGLVQPGTYQITVMDTGGTSNSTPFTVYTPSQGPFPLTASYSYFTAYPITTGPTVTADLNEDGLDDVITVGQNNPSIPTIAVLNGQKGGYLSSPRYLNTSQVEAMTTGDVNGDGHQDVVTVGPSSSGKNAITALLGDGKGNLEAETTTVITADYAYQAQLADFYGDGGQDLAVTTKSGDNFYLSLLQQQNGEFEPPKTLATVGLEEQLYMTVADFNGDGLADIAYTISSSPPTPGVHILLNQGGGTFTDTVVSTLSTVTGVLATADFNLDGCPDLAVEQPQNGEFYQTAAFYMNDCNLSFTLTNTTQLGACCISSPFTLLTGDFDHDGFPDLAAVNNNNTLPGAVLYLWGDGQGNFTLQKALGPVGSFSAAAGDINGDGSTDVIVPDRQGGAATVVLGEKSREFPSPEILLPSHSVFAVSVGDVNHDGFPDLLFGGDTYYETPGSVYLNDGKGGFTQAGDTPFAGQILADLNHDGYPDLVSLFGDTVTIWPGTGDPNYGSQPIVLTFDNLGTLSGAQIADVDGDGNLDILAGTGVLYGDGNFNFTDVQLPVNGPYVVADFNRDGLPDLATDGATLVNQGGRSYSIVKWPVIGPLWEQSAVGDFNGDGIPDFAALEGPNTNVVDIYLGRGDGTLAPQTSFGTGIQGYGPSPSNIATGDFNRDGLTDILVTLQSSNVALLLTATSSGQFQATYLAPAADGASIAVNDFNKDGKLDAVFPQLLAGTSPPDVSVVFGH